MGVLNFSFFVLILVPLKGCKVLWPMVSYHISGPPDKYPIEVQNPQDNDIFEVINENILFNDEIIATFLKFTGERRRYVETDVYPSNGYDKTFYIGMFYSSLMSSGTLFHYRANSNSTEVQQIKIILDNGVVKSSITCHSIAGCESSTRETTTIYNSWRFVMVQYTIGDNRIQLNGNARIGGSLDNPIGEFVGVFQCVAMVPIVRKWGESDDKWQGEVVEKWNEQCDYKKIDESFNKGERNRKPYTEVLMTSIWPLNSHSCGYEATKLIKPNLTPGLCSIWTSQTHNIVDLEEPSVATLAKNKYIKTAISDNSMYYRFSISMFLLLPVRSATILEVRFPFGYFESLTVKIDNNENIIVRLSTGETISKNIGNIAAWHFIAAQYNQDWKELSLIIDDAFYNTNVPEYNAAPFTTSKVELDIGDFDGNIACLTIFNTPLSENTATDLVKQECNKKKSLTAPVQLIFRLQGCKVLWPMVNYHISGPPDKDPIEVQNPQDNDVFEVINENVLFDDEILTATFLKFIGERRRYVETYVYPNNTYDKTFYIGMFYKSVTSSGTLFHYRANSNSAEVQEVKIILDNGMIKSSITCPFIVGCESSTRETTTIYNSWRFVMVQYTRGDNKIQLNGNARIGGSLDNPIGDFVGVFQCVAMVPKLDKWGESDDKWQDEVVEKWNEQCDYDKIIEAHEVNIWSMASYHIAGPPDEDPIEVQNPQDNDIFEVINENVLFNDEITATFLKFTGERRRYVETDVYPSHEYDKTFYIGMFYKSVTSSGTLFHYRAKSNSAEVQEIKIILDNGVVKSSITCLSIVGCESSTRESTTYNSWRFVMVQYTIGDNKIQLNGNARIGGSLDNPIGEFVGVFQCVDMVNEEDKWDKSDEDWQKEVVKKWNEQCSYEKIIKAHGVNIWPLVSYHIAGASDKDPIDVQNLQDNDVFEVINEDVLFSEDITATFLKFTGERRRYVESFVYDGTEYDKLFYIGMFYKSLMSSGTLFHYRANSNSAEVQEVKIILDNGVVKSSITCLSIVGCESSTRETTTIYNSWRFVMVQYTIGDNKIQLNGNARIGGSLDNPIGDFVGVFQCVAMVPKEDKWGESDDKWQDEVVEKWNEQCDYKKIDEAFNKGAISETKTRPFTEISLTSIWPLNNRSCGYEATKLIKPDLTPGLCSIWTSQTHNIVDLEEPSVATLANNTYVKTAINDISMYYRFSISMFLLLPPRSATILEVRFPFGYFESLTVKIDNNENIIVHLSTGETISKNIGNIAAWHFIAAQYNQDWKELSLIIDDEFYWTYVLQNNLTTFTTSEVELDIGDFDGNIACLTIFNTPLSENTATDLVKQECNNKKAINAPAEDAPKPVQLWPLSKKTMGFEMNLGQTISSFPTKLCWRFNLKESTNFIESEAVQFYGADQFSLLIDPIIISDVFVVGVFVKTKGINGTILKMKVDSESIELSMEQGNISLIVNNNTCLNTPWLFNDEWASVVLEISADELLLNVDDNTIEYSCGTIPTPTTLQLGGNQESFIGEMRCLEIFNSSIIATGSATSILTLECSDSEDFTPVIDQASPVTASHVWRLDNRTTSTYKQIHDMELLDSKQSLYFDGSSRLHLLINLSIPDGDMCLGFFFRPMQYTKGVILQDKSSDFHISIDDHRIVIYTISSCESVTFTGVTDGDWHWLMINRATNCKSLIFVLDGEVKYAHSKCFEISGLMEVRLGGEGRSFSNFRGDLSCLTLFDTVVEMEFGNFSMIQSCNSNQQNGQFEIEEDELLTISKFDIIATNSFPSDQGGTISEFLVKSTLDCSKTCTQTRYCRSYSINPTEDFITCTLFDFITLGGLKLLVGSKYYGILY